MSRPLPDPHGPEFAGHWEGLAQGQLRVRRCLSCGQHAWPPRPACRACHGLDHEWVEVGPHATLYSWTVVGHATLPGFEPPYAVVLGELRSPAGVRLLGGYQGSLADLRVGLPLTAAPVQVSDQVHLLSWRPAATPANSDDTDDAVASADDHTEMGEHQ